MCFLMDSGKHVWNMSVWLALGFSVVEASGKFHQIGHKRDICIWMCLLDFVAKDFCIMLIFSTQTMLCTSRLRLDAMRVSYL